MFMVANFFYWLHDFVLSGWSQRSWIKYQNADEEDESENISALTPASTFRQFIITTPLLWLRRLLVRLRICGFGAEFTESTRDEHTC